jgi:26S proteasome regulatory subunit N7
MDLAFTDNSSKKRGPSKKWTEAEIE